ncbi:FMN-binding protein [Myxococcota bacterium]|nr:FMN-binding protein [Myxococcota bacterium]MBU1537095.1 FMN-binding protein [Myxococcota bacterium]
MDQFTLFKNKNTRALVAVSLVGFATFFIQLLLLRHSLTCVSSNELTLGFFYGFWLLGMGGGAWFFKRGHAPLKMFLLFPAALFGIVLLNGSRSFLGIPPSQHLTTKIILGLMSLSILPAALLSGSLIPSIGGEFKRYFISLEAAGSLLAGALYTFGPLASFSSLSLVSLIAGPALIVSATLSLKRRKFLALSLMVIIAVGSFLLSNHFLNDHLAHQRLIHTFHSPHGKSLIYQSPRGTLFLFRNGKLSEAFEETKPPAFGDLLDILLSKAPKGPVVVAEDISTARFIALHSSRNVQLISYDPAPLKKLLFYAGVSQPPNLKIRQGDIFSAVEKGTALLIIPSNLPRTMKEARGVSLEFFLEVKKHLSANGTVLMGLELPGLHPDKPFLKGCSLARSSFTAVFPHVTFLLEEHAWILGSKGSPLDFSPETLRKAKKTFLAGVITDPSVLTDQLLDFNPAPSTLENPALLLLSLGISPGGPWPKYIQSVHHTSGTILFFLTRTTLPYFILALLGFSILFSRKIRMPSSPIHTFESGFAMFLAGLSAMVTQLALLNALQHGVGNILMDVGIVSGLFMAAYALGSLRQWVPFGQPAGGLISAILLILFTVFLPYGLQLSNGSLLLISILSSLSGFLTGSLVPIFMTMGTSHKKTLPLIFSMENLGAGTGALLGGAIFLPALGTFPLFYFLAALMSVTLLVRLLPFFKNTRPTPHGSKTFPWPSLSLLIFLFFSVGIFLSVFISRDKNPDTLPSGAVFRWKPFPHYVIRSQGKTTYQVKSSQIPSLKNKKGYAGPIETITTFDEAGTIVLVEIGNNRETPSFIERVKKWVPKFLGIKATVNIYGPQGVDTVSGASMSTEVVRNAVHTSRNLLFEHILHLKTQKGKEKRSHFPIIPVLVIIMMLLGGMVSLLMGRKASRAPLSAVLRFAFLLASLVTLGLFYNIMLSAVDLGLLSLNLLPTSPQKMIILLFILITGIFIAPLWCGYICPLGALSELIYTAKRAAGKLWKKEPLQSALQSHMHPVHKSKLLNAVSYTRYVLLGVSLLGFSIFCSQRWLDYDPLSFIFSSSYTHSFQYIVLALILTTSLFFFRPHCRFICPVGAFITLLGILAPLRRFLPTRHIRHCDYGVRSLRDITCIHCNRCIRVATPRPEKPQK